MGQRFDTNYGGTSSGTWLSEINDIDILPMNNVLEHFNAKERLKPEDAVISHPAKTVEKAKEYLQYNDCPSFHNIYHR